MREMTLEEILTAREQRAARQHALLTESGENLICLTLNIPGPRKCTAQSERIFRMAVDMVLAQLAAMGHQSVKCQLVSGLAGSEGYFLSDLPANTLKNAMIAIEDSSPVARLFDLDVLNQDGKKISREELGFPARKCLLCDNPAPVCARTRAHGLDALVRKANGLMSAALEEEAARRVARLAVRSLLYEVCAAPKPGLVDRLDSGSHQDMDIFTFMSGASSLSPFFADCYHIGRRSRGQSPEETFHRLRLPGVMAERTMYQATGGVNTHKGAIFSMGLICGALGRMSEAERRRPEEIARQCAAMTSGLTRQTLHGLSAGDASTNGERVFAKCGIGGVRAQAEGGFADVLRVGLPTLEDRLSQGFSVDEASCATLLALMAVCEDTNLISRGGVDAWREVAAMAGAALERENVPSRESLETMNRKLREKNLSPGGSADLLALSWFMHLLKTEP